MKLEVLRLTGELTKPRKKLRFKLCLTDEDGGEHNNSYFFALHRSYLAAASATAALGLAYLEKISTNPRPILRLSLFLSPVWKGGHNSIGVHNEKGGG